MSFRRPTAADRLRKLRKTSGFSPIWRVHSDERLDEYRLDKPSIERIVRGGAIGIAEPDHLGREQVHVSGRVDGQNVDVVVEVAVAHDGTEVVRIVTIKPKGLRR